MESFLKTIFTGFAALFFSSNACELLPDGIYGLKQTYPFVRPTLNPVEFDSELSIRKGQYLQKWPNGDSATGKLVWVYDCSLRLDPTNPQKTDTTAFSKILYKSFGPGIFELQDKKGDTVFFRTTYTANLHLTTSEGYFIRIGD